jgi:heme A synthase
MMSTEINTPGEMFTSSVLKKYDPVKQLLFSSVPSVVAMLYGAYVLHSDEFVRYAGCFGLVFFVVCNPWLSLLANNNKAYFLHSVWTYLVNTLLLFGLIHIWTGSSILTSIEMRILLISITFYAVVAYGIMSAIKILFLDQSGGGL